MTLTPDGYRPRLIDERMGAMLGSFGAVSIEGPRWCGKTWTAKNHANSEIGIADAEGPIPTKELVKADLRMALRGEEPHLIDEWQGIPALWDTVRSDVDKEQKKGRYILTGSSVPRRNEYVHSGTGRIGRMRMRTMTLYESGDSDGSISLRDMFDSEMGMKSCGEVTLERLIRLCVRGGWPGSLVKGVKPGIIAKDYVEQASKDAARMDGRNLDSDKMAMLLRSLARNESSLATNSRIMSDMKKFDNENIARETFDTYWDCLYRMHMIEDTPSFSPNVRSDARIGKAPKRHLTDVSLAIAALDLNEKILKNDLNTFGFMFESLCEHDLRIYTEHRGGRMFHYRDGRGREIDAVVETDDGRWGAFEIKLGAGQIDDAAENLLKMNEFFEKEGCPPSLLCVICGMTTYAYRRPDGVEVVPITSLGP